jgi:MFS family permease
MINRIFYGWWITLACSLIGLYVGGVIFFGFTAFIQPIAEEFGWSYTQISFAVSLRGLEMGIFAPFVGFLVDRFGPRKIIFWGIITIGVGLFLLSLTQSLVMFYGSFLIIAFGAGGCTALVTTTAVVNWFRKKAGTALGVMGTGFGAGGIVVLLIVRLIGLYQWRNTLKILGLGMWVIGIPLSFVIRNKPEQYGYLQDGEVTSATVHTHQIHGKGMEIRLKEAIKTKTFLFLNLIEVARMMTIMAVLTHVMPYLSNVGMSRPTAGAVAGVIPLIGIIGRFGFGWIGDIIDKRLVMAVTLGLISFGMLAFSYMHMRWAIFPFLILFPLGHGGSMVLRGSILQEYYGRDSYGKLLGIIMGSASIGGIIGPTLAGWFYDTYGNYRLSWYVFFVLLIVGIALILKIKPVMSGKS